MFFFVSNVAIGRMEEADSYNWFLRKNCEGKMDSNLSVSSVNILIGMLRADPCQPGFEPTFSPNVQNSQTHPQKIYFLKHFILH